MSEIRELVTSHSVDHVTFRIEMRRAVSDIDGGRRHVTEEYAERQSATWRLEAGTDDLEDRPDGGEDWEDEEDWDDDEWDDDEEIEPSPQSNSCTAGFCCSPTIPVSMRALA